MRCPLLLGSLAVSSACSCGDDGSSRDRPDSSVPVDAGAAGTGSGGNGGTTGAGGCQDPTPVEPPGPGWHRWDLPPCDCNIYVPDDVAALEPLVWEPCPFMPDGCTRVGATWAEEYGLGFGAGWLSVGESEAYFSVPRRANEKLWSDSLLVSRTGEIVAVWRYDQSDPASQCSARGPFHQRDGTAAITLVRTKAEPEPIVYLGPPETLITAPPRIERFGPPDSWLLPTGRIATSERLLVAQEHYNRFSVRDLDSGVTYRPEPLDGEGGLVDPQPVADGVYQGVFSDMSSIWTWSVEGGHSPVLKDGGYSYNFFSTDAVQAAWIRSSGPIGFLQFETVELWTAQLAATGEFLAPQKLADLPGPWPPRTSVGSGWVAVGITLKDVRLYRIADGEERRLPLVDGLEWHSGQFLGLVIANGAVWVRTELEPGTDIRYITRFEIDKLPPPPDGSGGEGT